MSVVLGLDIGVSSIGWALVDSGDSGASGRILAAGVRVFPEGVDRDQQGGEQSKTQARRTARGMRRQIARRRDRKKEIARVLVEAGLLPVDPEERESLLAINPYPLRAAAVHGPVEPFLLGRVLAHLGQRRGFLSNRKTDRRTDTKGLEAELSTLGERIRSSGCHYLGEYLARVDAAFGHTAQPHEPIESERKKGAITHTVRGLHTRRQMYLEEFEAIWAQQERHYPTILTNELKRRFYNPVADANWVCKGLIFGQRRIYWPKSVVGRCELEPKLKRCVVGERCAQRFRILQEVNNLRIIDRSTGEERRLRDDERQILVGHLSESEQRTFDEIRKKLGFSEHVRFNLEGPERSKLKGHITDAKLARAIGKKPWAAMAEPVKDAIASVVLSEEREEEGIPALVGLGLTTEQAQKAMSVQLPETRSSLSDAAINRLLPHLERGLALMGNDASDSAIHAAGYLRPDQREVKLADFLPQAPNLPNPIVRQAMVETRRVVNAILRELCDAPAERGGVTGGRRPDQVHVELVREAKKSFEQRRQMRFDNADRQREQEAAREEIEQHGGKATPGMTRKYRLWKEQGETCPYSGRKISLAQVLSEATDADHILPRWRSLDDSMMNKVVCFREENSGPGGKGSQAPREWLEKSDPDKWSRVLRCAEKLPYPKYRRFLQEGITLDDFVSRQLSDTAYISRAVSQYLRSLGIPVVTPRGGMTAELRRFWGLNLLLGDDGEKNRSDHRHHAVDAAVIALTNRSRLHALANARGRDVPAPWPTLRQDLGRVLQPMLVSHRVLRRIRGALHEDSIYGATQKRSGAPKSVGAIERPWARGWVENQEAFVRRKAVAALTDVKQLEKVRDPTIRALLLDHATRVNGGAQPAGALPKKCFDGVNEPRMPSGVPIKRVRMIEESTTIRPVNATTRSTQYVKPGSNHHVIYYASGDGKAERWEAEVVTMWDAALRARRAEPPVQPDLSGNRRLVMSLSIGEAIEMADRDSRRRVFIVRETDQRSLRILLRPHDDGRSSKRVRQEKDRWYVAPDKLRQLGAKKIVIDPIGRLRRAGD